MSWQTHIHTICNRLNQYSYALYNLAKVADRSVVLTVYHAYFSSTLEYGIIFWGNANNKYVDMVFKAQKKCVRAIANIHIPDSCRPYFTQYNILTFVSIYIYIYI